MKTLRILALVATMMVPAVAMAGETTGGTAPVGPDKPLVVDLNKLVAGDDAKPAKTQVELYNDCVAQLKPGDTVMTAQDCKGMAEKQFGLQAAEGLLGKAVLLKAAFFVVPMALLLLFMMPEVLLFLLAMGLMFGGVAVAQGWIVFV